ncbi:MAG: DUF2809 domain-containing protein [Deltaproteobacteria bacterium]|nr:DUF2809 domain-containing protein [Deltaproteobacteria bacterium]
MTRGIWASPLFEIKKNHLLAGVALLCVETAIALWVTDGFIRPYGGDFLVSILIYCTFRGIFAGSRLRWALISLGICFGVETLQGLHFVERVGLADCRLAVVIIGHEFSVVDLVAYTLGIALVMVLDRKR